MSETTGDNTGKTYRRLETERDITNRLHRSSRRQRAAVGLGLLVGVGAGIGLHERESVLPAVLIGSSVVVSIARRIERTAAYTACNNEVYHYQREMKPPEGMPPEEYGRLLADTLHVKTIISPDENGDATVKRVWDHKSVVGTSDSPMDTGLPFGASLGTMFDTWALSSNMDQPVVWSAVALGTIVAGGAMGLAELNLPSRDVAPYMRQLDNIDNGGSMHMAAPPETEV